MRGARATYEYSASLTAQRSGVVQALADPNELLPAACWCDSTTVIVEQRDVVAGRTRSCGALRCHGPNGERETSAQTNGRRLYSWTASLAAGLHERDKASAS